MKNRRKSIVEVLYGEGGRQSAEIALLKLGATKNAPRPILKVQFCETSALLPGTYEFVYQSKRRMQRIPKDNHAKENKKEKAP